MGAAEVQELLHEVLRLWTCASNEFSDCEQGQEKEGAVPGVQVEKEEICKLETRYLVSYDFISSYRRNAERPCLADSGFPER